MLVATNRNIVETNFKNGVGDENGFGEGLNPMGPDELRLAYATPAGTGWELTLVDEPMPKRRDALPLRVEFQRLAKHCAASKKNCLFYVHGFNAPFRETLKQAWQLQDRYAVEVVLFSWPSNPGGLPPFEHRKARGVALASYGAFDSLLEKYATYLRDSQVPRDEAALLNCGVTVNLMTHSLGSYLFEYYVLSAKYNAETRIFTNVVLSQADVDSAGHAIWVDKIVTGQRVSVTINENDGVLKWSETICPPRLGRNLANLVSTNATYFDFTGGEGVERKHQLWTDVDNEVVKRFFGAVLNGEPGEDVPGFTYDSRVNAFRIDKEDSAREADRPSKSSRSISTPSSPPGTGRRKSRGRPRGRSAR